MPKWLWQLSPKILNYQTKHLLSYIWWYGDKGCNKWNWYLAKRARCSDRTIRRRLNKLHVLHLVCVVNPHYKRRRIYRLPYFSHVVWQNKRAEYIKLTGRTQMTYIYDLVEVDMYKTTYPPATNRKGIAGGDEKFVSGALPPNPPAGQYTAKQKRYRLDREKSVDKLLSAGYTLTIARYRSLLKYPLLDFEKC